MESELRGDMGRKCGDMRPENHHLRFVSYHSSLPSCLEKSLEALYGTVWTGESSIDVKLHSSSRRGRTPQLGYAPVLFLTTLTHWGSRCHVMWHIGRTFVASISCL
ncbi:uncharacterized protein YALI1_A01618g [Yarrowia lipolytica]|uniref:SRCR domain-containing protein n=1 Tax=Yarrowia lipolytica TaxID=4952 RepID=A0A1D8N3B3_YARLL|nr:hypothetical protein YALI1_A01618g [Yarrowia lipolytica]